MEHIIRLIIDEKRQIMDIDRSQVKAMFDNFKDFGFAPLVLNGHEGTLFCKHMSFQTARNDMQNPVMKPSRPIKEYATIDFDTEYAAFSTLLSALGQVMSNITIAGSAEATDVEVLRIVMGSFVPYPVVSYKEVYLEYGNTKNLVGGKVDLLVGSCVNGSKPMLKVVEKSKDSAVQNVFLGSLSEGRNTGVTLFPMSSVNSDFNQDVKQNLTLVQPMVQAMAFSEVCTITNANIPVINFFGNRHNFRPILYFRQHDVMLTTPKPLTFMLSNKMLCLQGLVMLHILLNIHRYPFHESVLKEIEKTGWAKAKNDHNPHAYEDSIVTDEIPQNDRNPNTTNAHIHTEDYVKLLKKRECGLPLAGTGSSTSGRKRKNDMSGSSPSGSLKKAKK